MSLIDKTILITGAARRIGRTLALCAARSGANIILHHNSSSNDAQRVATEIIQLGVKCWIVQADFSKPKSIQEKMRQAFNITPVFALVNNAAIFKPLKFKDTSLLDWQSHFDINLTAPFLLSQLFAASRKQEEGKIINILDWRAFRPGIDHFPYVISKAALADMTKAMARALAPSIQVNGLALGAILPPSDGNTDKNLLKDVPANRWADLDEVCQAFLFLLDGPGYITGEIIHVDGGRHLV